MVAWQWQSQRFQRSRTNKNASLLFFFLVLLTKAQVASTSHRRQLHRHRPFSLLLATAAAAAGSFSWAEGSLYRPSALARQAECGVVFVLALVWCRVLVFLVVGAPQLCSGEEEKRRCGCSRLKMRRWRREICGRVGTGALAGVSWQTGLTSCPRQFRRGTNAGERWQGSWVTI